MKRFIVVCLLQIVFVFIFKSRDIHVESASRITRKTVELGFQVIIGMLLGSGAISISLTVSILYSVTQ